MHPNLRTLVIIGTLAAGTLAVLGWQRGTTHDLRVELARQRAQKAEAVRQAEERDLTAARAHAEKIDLALTERAAVAHLRNELEALRRRAKAPAGTRPVGLPATQRPTLTGNVVPFTDWRNLGRGTPEASLETALWASANGDIDTLANLLVFDPEARNEATTLFSQLPESFRQEFVSSERMVAFLAAKDVPLGSATILNQYPLPTETRVALRILDAEGTPKTTVLTVRPDDAGWRFVVPTSAVKRYADWLRAPANSVTVGGPVAAK